MIIDYISFTRVATFYFGNNISLYKYTYKFLFEPCDDKTGWDEYSLDEYGIVIYTDGQGVIESISCDKTFIFRVKEIISMNILNFSSFFDINMTSDPDPINMNENEIQNC